ncbi:UNVERIFIED_CONTAM: hypothetical protein DES50_11153 [Williamsia faeni]
MAPSLRQGADAEQARYFAAELEHWVDKLEAEGDAAPSNDWVVDLHPGQGVADDCIRPAGEDASRRAIWALRCCSVP